MKDRKGFLERLQDFRLLDDEFMTKCFEKSPAAVELVLHLILGDSSLKVLDIHTQHHMKNLQGRSITLDIFAKDKNNKKYNIEIQRAKEGAGMKRARYHSSLLDANSLKAGEQFDSLPETYVIFLTEHDIFGKNLPLYHVDRYIADTGEEFSDGAHIIYVNGACKNETPLGRLMQDFAARNADEMNYSVLAERVRFFKEEQEGQSHMSEIMESLRQEGVEEGILIGKALGEASGIRNNLLALVEKKLRKGYSVEVIADALEEDVDLVNDLIAELKSK